MFPGMLGDTDDDFDGENERDERREREKYVNHIFDVIKVKT